MSPVQNQSLPGLQTEPVLERYFQTFNNADFERTAALFAPDGQLQPPFEEPITGVEAIAQYLKAEAEGMQAYPQELEPASHHDALRRVIVRGRVKAIVFKVNAAWIFDLNEGGQIHWLRVKLLASMQELLNLREQ